jgi:hypothetical protein
MRTRARLEPPRAWREGAAWREALESGLLTDVPLSSAEAEAEPSEKAISLLIAFEVTSPATYEKKYRRPIWPGGQSGVTIGIGYDVGWFPDKARLWTDWGGVLSDAMITALERAIGVKGPAARDLAKELARIVDVPWSAAEQVFRQSTLPFWSGVVSGALPNTGMLSADGFGALLSLTYNRGPSYAKAGDRYREMRAIKAHMGAQAFSRVPIEIRAMKRLWPDVPGLQRRRDREADLFRDGLDSRFALPLTDSTSGPSLNDLRQAFADTLAAVANTPVQSGSGRRFFFPNGVGELDFEATVGLEKHFRLSVSVKDAAPTGSVAAENEPLNKLDLESRLTAMLNSEYDYEIRGRLSEDGVEYLLLDQFDEEAGGQLLVRASTSPKLLAADTILAAALFRGISDSLAADSAEEPDEENYASHLAIGVGEVSAAVHRSALACEGKLSSKEVPGTNGGRLGCAWAVNEVVRRALRRPIGGGLSTANMEKVLRSKHARVEEADAEPGVIIISPTSGGKTGHVGVVGEPRSGELLIYSNSSSRGLFLQNYTSSSWRRRYQETLGLQVVYYRLTAETFSGTKA